MPAPGEVDTAHRWAVAKFEQSVEAPIVTPHIEVLQNHGPVQCNARGEKPMQIVDKSYTRGFYCHAPSKMTIVLPGPGKTFDAIAGVDSNDQTSGGQGSVVFVARVGEREAWRSPLMREGMPGVTVSVDLKGATQFELAVEDGGDGISCDQSDWADARVTLEDGTVVWLAELPLSGMEQHAFTTDPFFSFVYGGKPSQEFLASWKREHSSKNLDDQRVEHSVTYTDSATGLQVRCAGIEYRDFPTVEWTLFFKNTSTADTPIIENIQAIDTRIERSADGEFNVHYIDGDNCTPESYAPHVEALAPGSEKRIANTGGRPTQVSFPYFNIEWPGEGVIFVVSWPGQWSTAFTRDTANGLQLRAGQELTHFLLHPGEEVRTPMIVLQFYKGDWLRAQNVWRRWMFAHNYYKPGGHPLKPQLSLCNGNYYPALMTVADKELYFIRRHIEEGVQFDCWWQDAGWYPCDGVGWPKTGTWEVDPVRFPKGIRELSDYVRANGRKTMVWFEPERVHPDTWITENHPEWVHGGKNGGLLKLGDPECREWLTNHIDQLLKDQGIEDYRQDFNMDPLNFWRQADTEDRQGITEIRHVEGYFAYWDELQRRVPTRMIDSCASGGRRNDLETLRRAVPLLRSDWYNAPEGQQNLTYGLSLWIPYHGTGVIYERDEYWVRSSMVAEFSFGPDAKDITTFDFARWRRLTGEWRRIAPYFLGDFHPLTPYTQANDVWMAWQFDRPDLGEGVVQVYRRFESPYESARFCLRDLEPDARYSILDIDTNTLKELSGAELMKPGLTIAMEELPKAKILIYKKVR